MPASGTIKLPDANVWLALAFSDHFHHARTSVWFDAQSDGTCAFCRVTQMALLRHLTNTKIMGPFVQSQQDAWKKYDQFAQDPRVIFLPEPATLEVPFRKFTQLNSPSHALWTDAYLASFAVVAQAQLVTFDQGFSRFAGLDLIVLSN
ncbi:MAG: PIN domain-containing protein [Verrucomicrobia bacterium]|nr:PIN domain-containing protein [Verrucomicrobiota bacterium]